MDARAVASTNAADREIVAVRIFDAPRDLAWSEWTDPQQIVQWWGPNGFTTSTYRMEVKPGGVWRFVMHGPDGVDYRNKVTFIEGVPPERLVFKHGGDEDCEPVSHETTVTVEAQGNKTKLTMRMLFASAEVRRFTVEKYGAVEGLGQTLGRLGEYATKRAIS